MVRKVRGSRSIAATAIEMRNSERARTSDLSPMLDPAPSHEIRMPRARQSPEPIVVARRPFLDHQDGGASSGWPTCDAWRPARSAMSRTSCDGPVWPDS